MSACRTEEVEYPADATQAFAPLARSPWAVFLDSGRPHGDAGRWDVLAAGPVATLVTRGAITTIADRRGGMEQSAEDPFALLRRILARHRPAAYDSGELPFAGGAIGYFAYDLARRIERLPERARDVDGLPEMAVGIYDVVRIVDHETRRAWRVGPAARIARSRAKAPEARLVVETPLRVSLDAAGHRRAVERILRYLRDGDCYQVNLARRFSAAARGDAWPAYCRLRERNPAPFGAYLRLPFCEVLSASPERFLAVREGGVETRPIKGTRPRSADPAADARLARSLQDSPKDRAENLMIVDLLRNDLGKACVPGSIAVPRLFALETHPTVHHLVSTVTGRLRPDRDALDLLRGAFPGGSITGAPKRRAMQIIEELEPHRRALYCGAIGYVGFDGAMDTSIAIRTLVVGGGEARFWAGGGIVADSEPAMEYAETEHKAAVLRALLAEHAK
jgi:para-aminobenzoate synthetase component 1